MTYRHLIPRKRWWGLLWLSSVQYFIVQVLVARAWSPVHPYSWRFNTISDLGNTHCGAYGSKIVCSPYHLAMNASFLLIGLTMMTGSVIGLCAASRQTMQRIGFACILLAGIGTMLVGFFPENTISGFHITGAALVFIAGNLGMIIVGLRSTIFPKLLAAYSILSGSVGIICLVLFYLQTYLGLGEGGMERLTAYPLTLWMIVLGIYLLSPQGDSA
jgi:hypothetical membrane protein